MSLDRLAEAYGLQLSYLDVNKKTRRPSGATKRAVLQAMGVAAEGPESIAESLAVAPPPPKAVIEAPRGVSCHMPGWLRRGRAWGITCQLYGLRSARNHGIGDFEDLARLAETAAAEGADFIGINPVHALFTAEPERCSPFSPSNRLFLNPLYIALDRLPGIASPPPIDEEARLRLKNTTQVDYGAVASLKIGALRTLWRRIEADPALWDFESRSAFDGFVAAGGTALLAHARFETLSHHMVSLGKSAGWHGWPETYRRADGEAVLRFAAEHDEEVRFHHWLQWVADVQLCGASARARAAGMRIGLYIDCAVGTAPDGSATWSDSDLVVRGIDIGAPPDSFFLAGQDWGLAPISPVELRSRNFAPFRALLESVMKHAGAVRVDHAMSLYRLYWIPHGMPAAEGCYVLYPLAEMLRTLAGVSVEQKAVVIGEDLGTVPSGFRETMRDVGMLSCRVLYFEWVRSGLRAAASYPKNAFLSVATHDLAPLAAWWTGADIPLFESLGLFDAAEAQRRRKEREHNRHATVARLRRESERWPQGALRLDDLDATGRHYTPELAAAIHGYLARTPSRLLGVQFEDLCGAERPVNVPGTSGEYPNWRLRAPDTIENAPSSGVWSAIVEAVAAARPKSG